MEKTSLEITIISAKGLKDVGTFSKMDVYVAVSISGDPLTEQKTPVDTDGGSCPKWNYPMKFTVDEPAVQMNRLSLIFRLRHDRNLVHYKDVGEVHVPLKELLDKAGYGHSAVKVEYPVRQFSGNVNGQLEFSFKFGAGNKSAYQVQHGHVGAGANTAYPPTTGPYPPPPLVPPSPLSKLMSEEKKEKKKKKEKKRSKLFKVFKSSHKDDKKASKNDIEGDNQENSERNEDDSESSEEEEEVEEEEEEEEDEGEESHLTQVLQTLNEVLQSLTE